MDLTSNLYKHSKNIFRKEVFNSWILIVNATRQDFINVPFENVWLNPKIKVNNSFFKHILFDNNEGVFLSQETIENQSIKTKLIKYASLKRAILKRLNKDNIDEIKYKSGPSIVK